SSGPETGADAKTSPVAGSTRSAYPPSTGSAYAPATKLRKVRLSAMPCLRTSERISVQRHLRHCFRCKQVLSATESVAEVRWMRQDLGHGRAGSDGRRAMTEPVLDEANKRIIELL